jgi:hypothetical protein
VDPEGRFAVFSMNLAIIEENRGGAEVRDGRLLLTPERPCDDLKAIGFSTTLRPIRCGGRLVLVPEGRERAFCNVVNLGLPATFFRGVAYIREHDAPTSGRPVVPSEWAPLLLKAPVEGRVVEALSNARARVDFGSDRGAMSGLAVWSDPDGMGAAIGMGLVVATVVEVTPASCVIELKPPVQEWNRFRAGQRIFTRHPLADVAESLARKAAVAPTPRRSLTP